MEYHAADGETVFPSSFRKLIGARIVRLEQDHSLLELEATPTLGNYVGSLHGGVIASMIDMAGALAGACQSDGTPLRQAMTLSVTVSFLEKIDSGLISAIGEKAGGRGQIFGANMRVMDQTGLVIATGVGTYKYFKA